MTGDLQPWWQQAATVLAVLAPLLAIPTTLMTLHLRTLREAYEASRREVTHRLAALEAALPRLEQTVDRFERDFATKEEWLREAMAARQHIERLSDTLVRLETHAEHTHALARRVDSAARAVLELRSLWPGRTAVPDTEPDPGAP